MIKRNIDDKTFGTELGLEQVHSSEHVRDLEEEELAEVSGGGLAEARGAYAHASLYNGTTSEKLSSFCNGLLCNDMRDAKTYAFKMARGRHLNPNSAEGLTEKGN